MSKLLAGLYRFILYSLRGAGEGLFPFESRMPPKKNKNKRKGNNSKQSRNSNRERTMASGDGNTDSLGRSVSTGTQSSNPGRVLPQSPDSHDPPMTEQTTNPGQPSNVGNTSMDGRQPSGHELSSMGGQPSVFEQSTNDGPPPDDGHSSTDGRGPSGDDLSSADGQPSLIKQSTNAEVPSQGHSSVDGGETTGDELSSMDVQSSTIERFPDAALSSDVSASDFQQRPMRDESCCLTRREQRDDSMNATNIDDMETIRKKQDIEEYCRSLQDRVERVELSNKHAEEAIKGLTLEVRKVSGDMERERKKYREELTIMEEVHTDAVQKLKAEHDKAFTEMKTKYELEVHAKDAEVIRAKDEAIRREAQSRDEERGRRECDTRRIIGLLEGLEQNISKVDGKVGGLEKLVAETRRENRENHQDLANEVGGVVKEIGDGRQQHAAQMKQGIDDAVAKIGEQSEQSMNIMLEEGRAQNQALQQMIQGLEGGIGESLASLAAAAQEGGDIRTSVLHAIGHLRQDINGKIEVLSQNMRKGDDKNRKELTEVIDNLKQWFENLTFKAEKTNIVKICRA